MNGIHVDGAGIEPPWAVIAVLLPPGIGGNLIHIRPVAGPCPDSSGTFDEVPKLGRITSHVLMETSDCGIQLGNDAFCLTDLLLEEFLLVREVLLELAVEIVPGESTQRDAVQTTVQAGRVRSEDVRQRIGTDALEVEHIIAGRQFMDANLLLEPCAVQEVLRPILLPGEIRIVEIHGAIEQDIAGRALQGDFPDPARLVEALEDGDRVFALLIHVTGNLEPAADGGVVDEESSFEVADAIAALCDRDAGRGLDLGRQFGRLQEDLAVHTLLHRREAVKRLCNRLLVPERDGRA